jgi:hypothetical protein
MMRFRQTVRDRNGQTVRRYRWTQDRKVCVLDAPPQERKQGVAHTLNLLRGLQTKSKRTEHRARCVLVKHIDRAQGWAHIYE